MLAKWIVFVTANVTSDTVRKPCAVMRNIKKPEAKESEQCSNVWCEQIRPNPNEYLFSIVRKLVDTMTVRTIVCQFCTNDGKSEFAYEQVEPLDMYLSAARALAMVPRCHSLQGDSSFYELSNIDLFRIKPFLG